MIAFLILISMMVDVINVEVTAIVANPAVARVNVVNGNVAYHGSGTLVSKDIVITNWHVVKDGGKINVEFIGETIKAKIIKTDKL